MPPYLEALSPRPFLNTADGRVITVWELSVPENADYLSAWAASFRQTYCLDEKIDALKEGTGLSRAEYLTQLVFPDRSVAPGPGIRAGDFGELLISDYVERTGYWIPREKYAEKGSRNESVKGVDILGFKMAAALPAAEDTLLAFEVKAQLSNTAYSGRLQTAIDDSSKDFIRRAESLNAAKRRLLDAGNNDKALLVQRFQNASDNPYVYRSGAAAVLSDTAYDEALIQASVTAAHPNAQNLELIVIRGPELMRLVHALYERAADEA